VVVTRTFAWAHLPKTAGDTVATIFSLFPEIVEFSDPLEDQSKHAFFTQRPELVADRQRVLSVRRLPSWLLSFESHKSRRGLYPDYEPVPMSTAEEMAVSTYPDHLLRAYVDEGRAWPDRWIRVEHLVDDVLALLKEHHVKVRWSLRRQIRAMEPKNTGGDYERTVSSWFTDEMIDRMYDHNPLWREAERLAYAPRPRRRLLS
jgi:hypothetical protein